MTMKINRKIGFSWIMKFKKFFRVPDFLRKVHDGAPRIRYYSLLPKMINMLSWKSSTEVINFDHLISQSFFWIFHFRGIYHQIHNWLCILSKPYVANQILMIGLDLKNVSFAVTRPWVGRSGGFFCEMSVLFPGPYRFSI